MTKVATLAALLAACSTVEGDVIQHPVGVQDAASLVLTTPPPDELVWWQSIGNTGSESADDAVLDGDRIVISGYAETTDVAGLLPRPGTFLYAIGPDVEVGADRRLATAPSVFGPTGHANLTDLAAAAGGGVLVAGQAYGPVEFSPGVTLDAPSNTSGRGLLFVSKYVGDQATWVSTFELAGGLNRMSIGSSTSGSYLAITFGGTLQVGETSLVAEGVSDGVLIALDPEGGVRWMRPISGPGLDGILDIVVADEAITLCWLTEFSGGASDRHLRRYDSSGNLIWEVDGGGMLAALPDGSFYSAWGNLDGSHIERRDSNGALTWSVPVETRAYGVVELAVDSSGRVIAGGAAWYGGGAFLEVHEPSGELVLGRIYPGGSVTVRSILPIGADLVIAGYYSLIEGGETLDLGWSSLPFAADPVEPARSGYDAFFARLRLE